MLYRLGGDLFYTTLCGDILNKYNIFCRSISHNQMFRSHHQTLLILIKSMKVVSIFYLFWLTQSFSDAGVD